MGTILEEAILEGKRNLGHFEIRPPGFLWSRTSSHPRSSFLETQLADLPWPWALSEAAGHRACKQLWEAMQEARPRTVSSGGGTGDTAQAQHCQLRLQPALFPEEGVCGWGECSFTRHRAETIRCFAWLPVTTICSCSSWLLLSKELLWTHSPEQKIT